MPFVKYHGLGNDYIVIDGKYCDVLNGQNIVRICDVHFGIGGDGILLADVKNGKFSVKIFNPDASQAEKSGNGLRIFSRYLFDKNLVKQNEIFSIFTLGGEVKSTIIDKNLVKVEMGKVSILSINEKISVLNREFLFCEANVGNPHCVIVLDEISCEIAQKYGKIIETDKRFVNRTNVQFMKIIDKNNVEIEIWERGAGYTLASGSSSTAAAAVAYKLGLCENEICVKMAGGTLKISFDENFFATMSGAVQKIGFGEIDIECFA
ncbi:MAG: diaminopimelate epimerase [Chitinivibrionia bacterium]|nr:diaminopimelate epimerase [Chitinivibrionia bacterium]